MLSLDQIADVQGFNQVYLRLCKQIDEAVLQEGYSLTEKDVLLEISKTKQCTANILIQRLHIDRSYMSRMIAKFHKNGLIEKTQSPVDNRINHIRLTEEGRQAFNRLRDAQNKAVCQIFRGLDKGQSREILDAMVLIRNRLSNVNDEIQIRPFTQSDIEYVISRHKTLYYAECHLSEVFSAYVDNIVYAFAENFDPKTDCMQILECNGSPAGSAAAVKVDDETAQLRFFMIEPEMRQRGYGNKLFEMMLDFCKEKGYKKIFLVTITVQTIARHIYESHGFHSTWTEDCFDWGEGIVQECWELELG